MQSTFQIVFTLQTHAYKNMPHGCAPLDYNSRPYRAIIRTFHGGHNESCCAVRSVLHVAHPNNQLFLVQCAVRCCRCTRTRLSARPPRTHQHSAYCCCMNMCNQQLVSCTPAGNRRRRRHDGPAEQFIPVVSSAMQIRVPVMLRRRRPCACTHWITTFGGRHIFDDCNKQHPVRATSFVCRTCCCLRRITCRLSVVIDEELFVVVVD